MQDLCLFAQELHNYALDFFFYSDAADWLADKCLGVFFMHGGNWCSSALWFMSINRTELVENVRSVA